MNGPEESKPPAAPEASGKKPANPRPRAPKPITTLSGTGGYSFTPKPSKVPHDPPIYFPKDLWSKTNLILLKAQRAFPLQEQALQLCKRVISDMTPLFVDVVKAGKIKADAVQKRDGGGMEDLLRLLLECNDGGVKSGFGGLSDTAYDLYEKVRGSDEWLAMAEAIEEAQQFREINVQKTGQENQNAWQVPPRSWTDIEIAFLSDERIEVRVGAERKHYNYTEFGFEDRRNGRQNQAWEVLRQLAEKSGTLPRPPAGQLRASVQKRLQEIREWMQKHFNIQADPVPFNGSSYQTAFVIGCRPSSAT